MNPARRFRFGEEPPATLVHSTMPLPSPRSVSDAQVTAPLASFMPPARALPFCESPTAPMPPPAPFLPLVPPLPQRGTRRSRLSFHTMAALMLLALDVLVLGYLAATWGR